MARTPRPVEIWRAPEVHDALLLLRGDLSAHAFPRHTHDEFVVGINVRGAHSFWCRGRVHEVPPGTVALVNAGEVHTGAMLGARGWDYRAFYVPAGLLRALRADAGADRGAAADPAFEPCAVPDPALASALQHAHALLADRGADPLERESGALEALTVLAARHAAGHALRPVASGRRARRVVAPAWELIRAQYDRPITLDALCALTGLGKYGLIRAFRAAYGQPPYELVTALRVAEARRRLARGDGIARAAAAVGFADQSHLARHFKRIVGVTPGQYARAVA